MTDSDQPHETLQDLVLTRLRELGDKTGPMSSREAVRRADGLVSYETVRVIARGLHDGGVTDRVAEGLSRALQVPLARVYDAAGVPQPGDRWELPSRFSRLDAGQRRLVEEVATALLDAYDKGRKSASGE